MMMLANMRKFCLLTLSKGAKIGWIFTILEASLRSYHSWQSCLGVLIKKIPYNIFMPIERSMLDQRISQAKKMSKWTSQQDTSVIDVCIKENASPFLLLKNWKTEEYYKLGKTSNQSNWALCHLSGHRPGIFIFFSN